MQHLSIKNAIILFNQWDFFKTNITGKTYLAEHMSPYIMRVNKYRKMSKIRLTLFLNLLKVYNRKSVFFP